MRGKRRERKVVYEGGKVVYEGEKVVYEGERHCLKETNSMPYKGALHQIYTNI